ncbi:carbonic anhydrase [Promicromonospora sukumoe]|uniref:carbonic anhydrase n=1 Tax=Promicromonospora sukumoe TaxID=88382 RepID=UPI0037CB1614
MKKHALPTALLLLPLLASCGTGTAADDAASDGPPPGVGGEVHWTYEGAEGPAEWGHLSADFEACSTGDAQSPIDLPAHADQQATGHPTITSSPTVGESVDTGHTVQLVPESGASTIEWDGAEFALAQTHFHVPSEHTVEGEAMDAEFHLVHSTEDGRTLVIGVLAEEGAENAAWQPFVEGAASPGTADLPLDVAAMLPTDPTYEAYEGSLTTPPCTEGVQWVVYATPVELSAEQIAVLDEASHGHNARPTLPQGDRTPYEGTLALSR